MAIAELSITPLPGTVTVARPPLSRPLWISCTSVKTLPALFGDAPAVVVTTAVTALRSSGSIESSANRSTDRVNGASPTYRTTTAPSVTVRSPARCASSTASWPVAMPERISQPLIGSSRNCHRALLGISSCRLLNCACWVKPRTP